MAKYISKSRVALALILLIAALILIVSGCDIGIGQRPPSGPANFGILAPAENAKVLVDSPVQLQSAFQNPDAISRAELWVREPNADSEKLLRSDVPSASGVILQEWVPQQSGPHTVFIRPFNTNNQPLPALTRQIQVLDNTVISSASAASAAELRPPATPVAEATRLWATPTLETLIERNGGEEFTPPPVAAATATPAPTATPTPFFPPPPAAPGVPPGPTQKKLPKKIPPVCDAAEYLGPFDLDPGSDERIFIPTDDPVPAKVAAGTIVHRAWRIRNVGTCTWGPNYELAFYGGRAMGSGGVPFESFYPSEPDIRNRIESSESLIAPEGKPNQIAVAEVLLNTPVIPGIHQSYWRMRNPQGVYFGPIVGVTLEVVRECRPEPGGGIIYGAPTIRRFRILGIGRDLAPEGAGETIPFRAEVGDDITLDWELSNTTNFTIIRRDPTGDIESISTNDPSDRAIITVSRVGEYVITLFAENGICAFDQTLRIDVRPPEEERFVLTAAFAPGAPITTSDPRVSISSGTQIGTIEVDWRHFDNEVDEVILHADRYTRQQPRDCFRQEWLGLECPWEDLTLDRPNQIPLLNDAPAGTAQVCSGGEVCQALLSGAIPANTIVQDPRKPDVEELMRMLDRGESVPPDEKFSVTAEQHSELIFCRPPLNNNEEVYVNFYVEARVNGNPADPQFNTGDPILVRCTAGPQTRPPVKLKDELF